MIVDLIKKHRRFITFGIVGCINTLVDFSVFTLLGELAGWNTVASHVAGYCCGIFCSFMLNRGVTFKDTSAGFFRSRLLRFVAVNCATLTVSSGLIAALTGIGIQRYFSKAAVALCVMVMNYFGSKHFVFNKKNTDPGKEYRND